MFVRVGDHLIRAVSFGSGQAQGQDHNHAQGQDQGYAQGPREERIPFVAHGGWTGSWELWEQPFEVLSTVRRCIGFDHLGSGESPLAPGRTLTLDDLVENLRQLLDALAVESCILAGESSGSKVVLQFALSYPERVKALVLVDGFAGCAPKPAIEAQVAAMRADYDGFVCNFVNRCIPSGEPHLIRWGNNIIRRSSVDDAVMLWEIGSGSDLLYRLDELHMPTLILHGEKDEIIPISSGKRMSELIANATWVSIPDAGHVPTLTHPESVVASIQEFLSQNQI